MADKKSEGKKGKPSNAGKRNGTFAVVFGRLPMRKLRRVLKNSGIEAAESYAKSMGLDAEFRKLVASGLVAQREAACAHRFWANQEAKRQRRATRDVRKALAELKAKRSAAAKKAAATRKAKKAAAETAAAAASA